ncbi:MAG: DUF1080 domain-containing protein [Phycisphaeraceae bacterium]|nr:DUF1080 domain-containing protein [Phycisphaeraceae bacterium]
MANPLQTAPKRSLYRLLLVLACLAAGVVCPASLAQLNNEPPEGFEPLFTGRDLDGWDGGEVKPPSDIAKMSYQDWYNYRKRMTNGVNKHWRVEDGALVGSGGGPGLVSWKHYGDCELWIDWKVQGNADAGLGLRFGSQIKLWDPDTKLETSGDASKGSGGLWTNQTHASLPAKRADKPVGQWNRMHVRIVGPFVTVILNGEAVVENTVFENIFDRDRPIDRGGPIHLHSHSGEVRYRNLFIRELSAEESNEHLGAIAGDKEQFTPLFNGKDLAGWAGALKGYEVVDGTLRCRRKDFGNIQTEKQYSDFVVRMEFKLSPGGNNGLLIRTPNTNPTHTRDTLEIQILDDHHVMHKQLAPSQYHGSAYGIKPAIRGYLRPTGQWNHQQLVVKGDHVQVTLNGYPILDTHLKQDAPGHPASTTKQGHFGLSGYSDPVAFRNILIKEIK